MKTIKYGIIGVGNMGSGHLKLFMEGSVEGAVVTAIADLSELKRNKVKETYPDSNFAYYESGEELIEKADVDAVIVAVPHYDHPTLVIQALKKGISAICENEPNNKQKEKEVTHFTYKTEDFNFILTKNNKESYPIIITGIDNPTYFKIKIEKLT